MQSPEVGDAGQRRTVRGFVLLGVALALAGCGKLYVHDIATDALDPSNLADTEPSIAVNPRNASEIAIVAFSENWTATQGAPVWKSSDGGATWRKVFQIVQPAAGAFGPADQKIDFDGDGKLLVAELGIAGSISDFVYRQTGLPDAALTPGAAYGNDQPHLSVDKGASSPHRSTVYSPWLDFSLSLERSTVSWSSDAGATEHDVGAGDNGSFRDRTTRIAVAHDGAAYIVYKTREGNAGAPPGFENAHFRVNRSDDGGLTWTGLGAAGVSVHGPGAVQTWFTTAFGNLAKGKVARARSSDAWIAAHPRRKEVYVAHVKLDPSGLGQIYVARSDDGGATWTEHRVTDGTHHSAFPEIAVTRHGVVGVLYIDYDDSGTSTIFTHHFARSFDGGATWHNAVLQSMDPTPIANAASGFLWGDYEGLTAVGNTFYGVFTGASSGRSVLQLDPIFFRQTSCRWWWLRCWFD